MAAFADVDLFYYKERNPRKEAEFSFIIKVGDSDAGLLESSKKAVTEYKAEKVRVKAIIFGKNHDVLH